jgi:hypothetical protein
VTAIRVWLDRFGKQGARPETEADEFDELKAQAGRPWWLN